MISTIVFAIGLVLIVEGLVYALAPRIVEAALEALRDLPVPTRRSIGLGVLALGIVAVWLSKPAGL